MSARLPPPAFHPDTQYHFDDQLPLDDAHLPCHCPYKLSAEWFVPLQPGLLGHEYPLSIWSRSLPSAKHTASQFERTSEGIDIPAREAKAKV